VGPFYGWYDNPRTSGKAPGSQSQLYQRSYPGTYNIHQSCTHYDFQQTAYAIQKPVLVPLCYLLIFLSPLIWLMRWMSYLNGNSHIMTRLLTFAGTQTPKQLDFTTLLLPWHHQR
jgi:hypothetical protein